MMNIANGKSWELNTEGADHVDAETKDPSCGPFKSREEMNQYFVDNEKLIHKLIQKYRGLIEYEDLRQEASLGFFEGCRTFDPSRGVKLNTYACECALNRVKMALRAQGAQSRTATVVSLDAAKREDNPELSALINQDLSEDDGLHEHACSLEDAAANRDVFARLMHLLKTETSPEQQMVVRDYMMNVPQNITAEKLGVSQSAVSKTLRSTLIELRLRFEGLGYN